MKVTKGSEILAGGESESEHSSAFDIAIDAQIITQPRGGVRRKLAGAWDRENLTTQISFSTVRKFTTLAEAETFALMYDVNHPASARTGSVTFGSCTMANALVLPPARRVNGVSVELRYTVIGGGFDPLE